MFILIMARQIKFVKSDKEEPKENGKAEQYAKGWERGAAATLSFKFLKVIGWVLSQVIIIEIKNPSMNYFIHGGKG